MREIEFIKSELRLICVDNFKYMRLKRFRDMKIHTCVCKICTSMYHSKIYDPCLLNYRREIINII